MKYFNNSPVYFLEDSDFTANGKLKHKTSKPVVIMVMGSFCGHCNSTAPIYEQFAQENPSVTSMAILVDGDRTEKALAQRMNTFIPGIQGIPAFVLFRNGKYVKTHQGPRTVEALRAFSSG
jgi:thiol-disulfide isomerase/thioredoxin